VCVRIELRVEAIVSSRAGPACVDLLTSVTSAERSRAARAGVTPAALMLLLQHVRRRKRTARAAFAGALRERQRAGEVGAVMDQSAEPTVVASMREACVGAP